MTLQQKLHRLCELEPDRFEFDSRGRGSIAIGGNFVGPMDWQVAGYLLEQMQERHKELCEIKVYEKPNSMPTHYQHLSEEGAVLFDHLRNRLWSFDLTPESILDAYLSWQEAK